MSVAAARLLAALERDAGRPAIEFAFVREIRDLCARSLADYKIPRDVRVVAALPRNAMGKVQKPRLVEALKREG